MVNEMDQIEWNKMSEYEKRCYNAGLAEATGRDIPYRAVCSGENTRYYGKGIREGRERIREAERRRARTGN